jgi:opacity protein-like surface antigen
MKRIVFGIAASLLLAITSSFAQTSDSTDNSGPKIWDSQKQAWVKWNRTTSTYRDVHPESLTPDRGDWTFSAGGAFVRDTLDLPTAGTKSTGNAYGGYVAGEYFVAKAVSIRGECVIISESQTVNTGQGIFTADQTEFILDVGSKFYPLQLTKAVDFRLQPFLRASLGGIFYDDNIAGTHVSIDPGLVVAVGGGADIVLNQGWALTIEGDYYSTLTDSTASVEGVSTTLRHDGLLVLAGLRYRF